MLAPVAAVGERLLEEAGILKAVAEVALQLFAGRARRGSGFGSLRGLAVGLLMMAGLYRVWRCGAGNRWFSGSLYAVCWRLPENGGL